jgi:hypothetical protein
LIVARTDETKILCYILLIVIQCLLVAAFALVHYAGRWISHRDPQRQLREKLREKFGSAIHHYDESMPAVETVESQSFTSEDEHKH